MEPKKLPIRLVGLDLDGTVFDSRKRISPRTAQAIERACAMGVQVLPATGRPENGVPGVSSSIRKQLVSASIPSRTPAA